MTKILFEKSLTYSLVEIQGTIFSIVENFFHTGLAVEQCLLLDNQHLAGIIGIILSLPK